MSRRGDAAWHDGWVTPRLGLARSCPHQIADLEGRTLARRAGKRRSPAANAILLRLGAIDQNCETTPVRADRSR